MRSENHLALVNSSSKQSADKSNQIYSMKFKYLLESLKQSLERFQKRNFDSQESSQSSKEMVIATINIIKILLENNNKDYWLDKAHRREFKEIFDVLNCYKGTFVPDVFNTQSLQFAALLLEFLQSVQQEIEQDACGFFIASQSKETINLLGQPTYFIQALIDTLQCNINFYQAQIQHALFIKKAAELQNCITEFFNYCQNNIIKIKPDSFNVFLKEYSAVVKSIMSDINKLPYFIIKSIAGIMKQQEPTIFESKEIELSDCRRALVCQLINAEYLLSVKMQSVQLPLLSIVFDAYQSGYILQESEFITNKFTQLIGECKSKSEIYIRGDHLGLLQSVDSKKVDLLNNMLKQVRTIAESKDNDLDVGNRCLSIYKCCLDAATKNAILSLEKNNPGEFSRVVNSIGLRFFAIVLNEISETNDVKIKLILDSICKLYQPPIIGADAETRIPQKEIDRFIPDVINHLRCNKEYMQFPVCDQTIVALLQDPHCTGELIRNNTKFFKNLLPSKRYERILLNILLKPNKEKIIYTQFWRNYLAMFSCDVMSQYINNGRSVSTHLLQSPAKSIHPQFATSIDSPVKSSPQRTVVNVHEKCYAYIAELVNSNMSGFLTADTIISVLMLYGDQFGEIIDDQLSSKFDLFIEVINQFIRQNYVFVHFATYLFNALRTHIPRLINDYEKNGHILFLLLTFIADNNNSSSPIEQNIHIHRLKNDFNNQLTKKSEAVVHLLKKFGNELTRKIEISAGATENVKYLIDQNHNVFANLLNNTSFCERELKPQDLYCLSHNLTLRQSIMLKASYFDILLQHDQCFEMLDYKEIERLLGITKSHHLLSSVNLIKLMKFHADLANFILSDASCIAKLLTSSEFNITLMRKYHEKIIFYLNHSLNINIIEAFSADIYLKLLEAKITVIRSFLFANVKVSLTILANKHNDKQFLAMYKNDFVKLLSNKSFCLKLDAMMLASLLSAFDHEELPTEFAQIAHHNPDLIKSIRNRDLDKRWHLYEPIYTIEANAGRLSIEQLIPLLQSTHPGCRLWLGEFYKAHSNNKNTVRLFFNDADAIKIAQNFPFYRPILENEPITQDDLEKLYASNTAEIDNSFAAPICLPKTHRFIQAKFNAEPRNNVCKRINLFAFLAHNKEFCINNVNHLVKFFSEEGHTVEYVKNALEEFFNEKANLINDFITVCDLNIVNQNISLFLRALSNEQLKLDNDNLIKLSYSSHPTVYLYLCKNRERFDVVKNHLPIDANQLMLMLTLLIENQGNHLLTDEKVVMNLVCRVSVLFNDFENNANILIALFKRVDTRILFAQLGPNELCKFLLVDDEKFIHDVITTYRQSLIFSIAFQNINLKTANNSLVKTILMDKQLRDKFFNHTISKQSLREQLYELYKRNDMIITHWLFDVHCNKIAGFNLNLLSGEQLRDLYFDQNNNFMKRAKVELLRNAELRKVFLPALSADQKRQFLYSYLLVAYENDVAEYFAFDADLDWLNDGSVLFDLLINNIAFANYVLQHNQLREIFNLTAQHLYILLNKYVKGKQQLADFLMKLVDKKLITTLFIDAIKYGQHETMLMFFGHNGLIKALLDISEFKNIIETYDNVYFSWDKTKLGQECREKLNIFCSDIGSSLIVERDIIKTMNNIAFDFDRNVKALTTLSNFSTDRQKRKRDLIAQISNSMAELNYSFSNASFDSLNKQFELLICLFELSQYSGNEFEGKIAEQVKQFCKELLGHNKPDDMTDATLLRLLISKCLVQFYHPGVLSLVLYRRPDLIDVDIIRTDKRIAKEFLFNPLLCQFLSAQSISAIVNNDHALAISCFAYRHIFCVLDNHRDALISVAKLAGIIVNDDTDKIFQIFSEHSTPASAIFASQSANINSRISPPVVQAVAKLNVFAERAASAPSLDRKLTPPVQQERKGSSEVVRSISNS